MRARVVALALGISLLAGCGASSDGDGRDGTPSREEFCSALQEFQDATSDADPDDLPAYVEALQGAADRLSDVGLPEGAPDEARAGFDITLNRIGGLPAAARTEDVAGLGDVSAAEQEQLDALEAYIEQSCPDLSEQ